MNDILRTFRLGTINLLGVTLPGLILIFLLLFGFLAPSILFVRDLASGPTATASAESCGRQLISTVRDLPPIGSLPGSVVLVIVLILAYVIGYIVRLSTPDELDLKSAKFVLDKMEEDRKKEIITTGASGVPQNGSAPKSAAEADVWPYQGEKNNKFPYLHFKQYLEHRQHHDLANHVKWGFSGSGDNNPTGAKPNAKPILRVRSKTFVNLMKIETSLRCPQLSGIIESDEAHIRMLYGTWLVCRICQVFLVFGFLAAVLGSVFSKNEPVLLLSRGNLLTPYLIWAAISLLLFIGALAGKRQIERLFHYRRVRELFDVVACYHLACEGFDPAGQPNHFPQKPGASKAEGQ